MALEVNDSVDMADLKRFVGRYCYGIYPAPAITCCHNGRMVRIEGKVSRIAKASYTGNLGVVIGDTVFHPAEIRCPSLKWTGEAYKARA